MREPVRRIITWHYIADTPKSLLEMAVLAYGTALGLALIILLSTTGAEFTTWLICVSPIGTSVLAVASHARQIVWTALGGCLAVGAIGFFSIGPFILQIGICLFLWWLVSSRRTGHAVVTARDLFWVTAGLNVMIVPFLIL